MKIDQPAKIRPEKNSPRRGLSRPWRLDFTHTAIIISVLAIVAVIGTGIYRAYAESYPSGSDNGQTSRLKSLSDDLAGLGYGSATNTPDWGALWNRINTASRWVPAGNVTAGDVRSGKTFYNANRTQQTGTLLAVGPCPTQAWEDSNGLANQTNNCTSGIVWTVPSPSVTGDEKLDPVTGLKWSQCLVNSSGTVIFAASGCTSWSWDASAAVNVAVGGKTAAQLCSERNGGGVWRLPSQKELMQAYIDGSYYNLSNTSAYHWSLTQNSATNAWYVGLSNGSAYNSKPFTFSVRCVR